MGNFKREVARNKEKRAKKEIKNKMNMFSRLPDHCLACLSDFDKQDRDMVNTWTVVVKEQDKKVNLYCPDCWGKARNLVEQYYEEKEQQGE